MSREEDKKTLKNGTNTQSKTTTSSQLAEKAKITDEQQNNSDAGNIEYQAQNPETFAANQRGFLTPALKLSWQDTIRVEIRHSGALSLLPATRDVNVGGPSTGYRILQTNTPNSNTYRATIEGKSGTKATFRLKTRNHTVESVQGATLGKKAHDVYQLVIKFADEGNEYSRQEVVVGF